MQLKQAFSTQPAHVAGCICLCLLLQPAVAADAQVPKYDALRIFADTSEEVLAEAAAYLEEIEIPEGEAVFHLGEVGDSMYIVIRGLVRCHIEQRPW